MIFTLFLIQFKWYKNQISFKLFLWLLIANFTHLVFQVMMAKAEVSSVQYHWKPTAYFKSLLQASRGFF